MKTNDEVEKLKQNWLKDPIYDLYNIEGFEEYEEELKQFQIEHEKRWEDEKNRKLDIKAKELGVSVKTVAEIERCECFAKARIKQAKTLLTHYFNLAGVMKDSDNQGEIESIVDSMVGASVSFATAEILKRNK